MFSLLVQGPVVHINTGFFFSSTNYPFTIGGRATLWMLRRKSKTQFVKQERNMQNAIALLNYLEHIAPQPLMLRKQTFTKKF